MKNTFSPLWNPVCIAVVTVNILLSGLIHAQDISVAESPQESQEAPATDATDATHNVHTEMIAAAGIFLRSLSQEKRAEATFEFDDELRRDWQFVPMERKGLSLKDLRIDQQHLAMALVQTPLSQIGFSTALQVMALEQVLHEMENENPRRDPAGYHLFFFGQPESNGTWGWRIEGHHLSISFTIIDGQVVSSTPAFFGTSPAEVRVGAMDGLRPLGAQEDLGRTLIKLLSDEQQSTATIEADAPADVFLGPGREAQSLEPKGIGAAEMNDEQRAILHSIIDSYIAGFRAGLADVEWQRIEDAGLENIHFAWAGEIEKGEPHYFRVQGSHFVLEYDNTQNDANHAHSVWRDIENDFGANSLRRHYETQPHENR